MAPQALTTAAPTRRAPALVAVDGRAYPLRSVELTARAEGGLAASTLVQEFQNPHDEPLEVIYTMPLPADGAVLGYVVRVGERVIRGEIEPREKAEAAYRKALYEGKTAGLLEEDRADTFQQRLGNVPPHTDVRVEIEILQPLAFLAGVGSTAPLWEYRFPTVVGPRYEGTPGRVGDAERLDLDRAERGEAAGIPTRMTLAMTVADLIEGSGGVTSPSHSIRWAAARGGTIVSLAEGAPLDRDLVLRWVASAEAVGVRLVEGPGLAGDDGRYALLTITPPGVAARSYRRDLTVLLDSSGSMSGQPIGIAKRVISDLLQSLEAGDRFEVWEFSNSPRRVSRGIEEAEASSIEHMIRKIEAITASGGTEMVRAFEEALKPLRADSQRQVILVTDGEIGFESEVLARMGDRLPAAVRVHVVGVGSAPNRTLTRGVARAGRGVELFASSDETAVEAARRLRAATVRPVLTDVTLSGSALLGAAPARPRDVFAGQPLVMAAELRPEGGTLEVTGNLAGSLELWIWRLQVPAASSDARIAPIPVGALYGRERVADLEIRLAVARDRSEDLDREIEATAMRHRIVSRRTSLVAIAEEPSVDPRAPRRRERLAVELPDAVSAEGIGLGTGLGAGPTTMFRLQALGDVALLEQVKGVPPTMRGWGLAGAVDDLVRKAFPRKAEPETALPIGSAALVSVEGKEALFELESPFDGFHLPRGMIAVTWSDGRHMLARVVGPRSSPRGPHAQGILVRLVLELPAPGGWEAGAPLALQWEAPGEIPLWKNLKVSFTVIDSRGSSRGA